MAGFFGELGYGIRRGPKTYQISLVAGSFGGIKGSNSLLAGVYWVPLQETTPFDAELAYRLFPTINGWAFSLPITLLITAVLPLAYASFSGWRFRLWHYFLFTAIVAGQLGWYLRPV